MKEWKCKECEVFDTHLCHFANMKAEYKACEHVVVDHNQAYEQGREEERPKAFSNGYEAGYKQGRADKEKEIKEKSVFYSNKPIEQIVLEARADAFDEVLEKGKEYYPNDTNLLYKLMYIAGQLKEQKQ